MGLNVGIAAFCGCKASEIKTKKELRDMLEPPIPEEGRMVSKDEEGIRMEKIEEVKSGTVIKSVFRCPVCGVFKSIIVTITYCDTYQGVRFR